MKYIIIFLFFSFNSFTYADNFEWSPEDKLSYVYLTWSGENTSNHITVNYHSQKDFENSQVFYSTQSRSGQIDEYEFKASGSYGSIGNLNRAIHRVTLKELTANTTYYFVVGDFKTGFSKEYKFKTLPDDRTPVRFITGGDMGPREIVGDMMQLAAERDPDFVAIGGDIAYADGKTKEYPKWDEWLKMYTEIMITSDGRLIPMALALGNHEVNFFKIKAPEKAPFYFGLFDQGQVNTAYFKKYFGDHTILYFLDSGFISSFGRSQKKWLKKIMKKNEHIDNQFAIYHIPLYPSHRKYNGIQSILARKAWLKTFDKYNLDLALENHDHTFKVSHPLKAGKVNESGTLYLGDGCWGRSPREAHPNRWYLKDASSSVHFWEVTASKDGFKYEAISEGGLILHSGQKLKNNFL